jgi:hypothetical protein
MSFDIFKYQSINLENTVIRNPRVGTKNRPTSRTIEVGCTGIGASDDIYTGETGVDTDYLIQGAVRGSIVKGTGTYTLNNNTITAITGINGLQPSDNLIFGDIVRADGSETFYNITGMSSDFSTIYLQDKNTTETGIKSFQARKIKLNSVYFEYVKSLEDENRFVYDKNNRDWRFTGLQPDGPLVAKSDAEMYIPGDPVRLQFLSANTKTAPDVTSIDTTTTDPKEPYSQKILESKLVIDTPEISLMPVPYPDDDENFHVYWGPQNSLSLKTKDIDYTVNYQMDPDYTSAKPPYKDRNVAYLKFLKELDDVTQVTGIDQNFQGLFNVHEAPLTPTAVGKAVTNIYPNAQLYDENGTEFTGLRVKVGDKVEDRFFDYNVEYDSGIVHFIKHQNMEPVVQNIIYNKSLLWDGISVIKGTSETGLISNNKNNLVIPYGISGLTGIDYPVFFEDVDQNDYVERVDYRIEYTSGAVELTNPLKSNECVLVSYFTEGEDVTDEVLNLNTLRTRKNPVIESSVTIKKKYAITSGSGTGTGLKILIENVDFTLSYLTGKVTLLDPSIIEDLIELDISYTPFAQINCIIQPVVNDSKTYRMTIVDDVLETVDPFNLRFNIQNGDVSVPVVDPFGENPTTYSGTMLNLYSVKGEGEPGFGLSNLTADDMLSLGMTGLESLGLAEKLGQTPDEFYAIGITGIIELGLSPDKTIDYNTTNYTYTDVDKILALDLSYNSAKVRPDINDLIMATYSFESETLPYAPIQTVFPVFNQDESSFIIEGFDKTDVIVPGMIFRIDNFDPEKSYYFIVKDSVYDGLSTTVYLTGSFPEDIRNPSFYLFDDIVQWNAFPDGTAIDPSISVGSNTLTLTGDLLKITDLIKSNTLILINDTDIYQATSVTSVGNTLQVGIFPNLLNVMPETIKITEPIYQVGDVNLISDYPVIIDPPHPAFSLRYVGPTNAVYSLATLFIDDEQIVLSEVVDDKTSVNTFMFNDPSTPDIRSLVNKIQATAGIPGYTYPTGPFTLISEEGIEQYYIGPGYWSSNLIIPFTGSSPVVIPTEGYVFTIKQEMFKHIIITTSKGAQSFLVEQKDRTDYFSAGNLLAFISKATGDISFYEVSGVGLVQEKISDKITYTHTQVSFNDVFTENLIDPNIYKYDSVVWTDIASAGFSIDSTGLKITFSSDSQYFRTGSMIKIGGKYVYQIRDISKDISSVTLTINTEINPLIKGSERVLVSDMPVYLDQSSPQKYFNINYTLPVGKTGQATVAIDDKYITIVESIDGVAVPTTAKIDMSRYDNLVQLASALSRVQLSTSNSVYVGLSDEDKTFYTTLGRNAVLTPTVSPVVLSASIEVSTSSFSINYIASDNTVDSEILMPPSSNYLVINEWKRADRQGTLISHTVTFDGKTLNQITDEIRNLASITNNSWSIGQISYDVYFGSMRTDYYTITQSSDNTAKQFPYSIRVTVNPKYWYQVGVLNRNILIEGTDYNIEGTRAVLVNPIQIYERYELSYLGLTNLAEDSGSRISCSCRYFFSIPTGYQVNVYMDYLNLDQYYIQKLTERKFIEIVTVPQIKDILQQSGESVGIGNDSGSDNPPAVYEGGLIDLYYYLKDEKIKKEIYLKIFMWYKQRLRNFAAEAQLTMGIKYGHSNFVGVNSNGQFTMDDAYVENEDYSLTTLSDIAQIDNSFSKFFPVGYNDSAPMPYSRFGSTYLSYNQVFCYNVNYYGETGAFIKTEGRVLSINPYWADVVDPTTTFSNLDFDILPYTQTTSFVEDTKGTALYTIPYDQEEKHFRSSESNFQFLKRIEAGDQVQLNGFKTFYDIATVEQVDPTNVNASGFTEVIEKIMFLGTEGPYAGKQMFNGTISDPTDPNYSPIYGVYAESDPTKRFYVAADEATVALIQGTPVVRQDKNGDNTSKNPIIALGYTVKNIIIYDRLILKDGESFTESGVPTFSVYQSGTNWIYKYTKKDFWGISSNYQEGLADLELSLPKDGRDINVKRNASKDFPVLFPAYDDEFNLGTKIVGSKIVEQKTGTDTIIKNLDMSDVLGIVPGDHKNFTIYEGTYDDISGLWKVRSVLSIDTTPLNFFDERSVSRILNTIEYGVDGFILPGTFPPFVIKISVIKDKKAQQGADKLFYVSFDKRYEANESSLGYYESIVFRSRDRNSWVAFDTRDDASNITKDYGFSDPSIFTNFYYPNNMYTKLLTEKQTWLTELNIIKDLFDTNDKLKRAFKLNIVGEDVTVSSASEFLGYLQQVSTISTTDNIKEAIAAYAEHLRFLLDSSDTNPYLVANTSGPLNRTMLEPQGTSDPVTTSYTQAAAAKLEYGSFQQESIFYSDLNDYYYSKWNSVYTKWVLGLEKGLVFQKQAKETFGSTSYIDVGIETFPAIKLTVVNQGLNPPFTVSNAKYFVSYDMLITADTDEDEYDNATLTIAYMISGNLDYTVELFALKSYPTLQNLVDAINAKCVHPTLGTPIISAANVFDYAPYRDYSTRFILRTYRATDSNDSNGPDTNTSTGGWTVLSTDPSVDDRIYASNVLDQRKYDSRVLFMNRKDIQSDTLVVNGENNITFPNYVSSTGKEILSVDKIGPLPVAGRWALNVTDPTSGSTVDYTSEFNVLDITPESPDDKIISYEFSDIAHAEEELPGQEVPMNPQYKMSPAELAAIGYDAQSKTITEVKPDIIDFNLYIESYPNTKDNKPYLDKLINDIVPSVTQNKPQTEIIRDLRIILRVADPSNVGNYRDTSFVFSMRDYPTVKDLKDALNNNRYIITLNATTNVYEAQIAPAGEGAQYFSADYPTGAVETLQGAMKSVDLVTQYVPQTIQVDSHIYYQPEYVYDIAGATGPQPTFVPITETIGVNYQVGWVLQESQGVINSTLIKFRINPRTYSPGETYRFVPNNPETARVTNILSESVRQDILAFDLYSWDNNSAYKIKDNVLYLRSDSIPETGPNSVSIPLYKTANLDMSIDHPEETYKLIDIIRLINNNGLCSKWFFANLRFGREYNSDYEYTYFPDTALWSGRDGWVSIGKSILDTLYLDIDDVFSVQSEGSNATYMIGSVDPLPQVPDPDLVYTSNLLTLQANTRAFSITPNTSDYDVVSSEYDVNSVPHTMVLNFTYRTFSDGGDGYNISSGNIQSLINSINSSLAFSATLAQGCTGSIDANNIVQAPNNSLPGIILAKDNTQTDRQAIVVTMKASYTGRYYSVSAGFLTLYYTQVVDTLETTSIDLTVSTTLNSVITAINTWNPDLIHNGFSSTLKWINGNDSSALLVKDTTESIPNAGMFVRMLGAHNYALTYGTGSKTIYEVVADINSTSASTGFSAIGLNSPNYLGYENLPADLLIPTENPVAYSGSAVLGADFRNTPGVYVLNMSHTVNIKNGAISESGEQALCSISSAGMFSCTKTTSHNDTTFIGNEYSQDISDKNISKFIRNSMSLDGYLEQLNLYPNLSYANGILRMDIALLPINNITYGKLRLRSKSNSIDPNNAGKTNSIYLYMNDPEDPTMKVHVYFGFLGDIQFYQISDYSLWKQYILIKRRLGQPWKDSSDQVITDKYVPNNEYDFESYEYTLNQVKNGKFLYYLKYKRFGELINSLNYEDLYNSKYMWLFLKFHKEIGCDQKVIALEKKINEDQTKALQLS